ncbi:MAG: hypothetical protein H6598_01445 [Flavobacteriales bacterium]|nr:hypothetical protein [Flavobacteriales bacterium]
MRIKYLDIILLLLVISSPIHSIGQKDNTDKLIDELYQIWETAYSRSKIDLVNGDLESAYKILSIIDTSTSSHQDLNAKIFAAQSDLVKKDWGLKWTNGYVYNTAPGMDVADNIIYQSRIQSEFSWNILDNGFLDNRTKSKVLYNESLITGLEDSELNKLDVISNWHSIIYQFNIQKIEVLKARLDLAEKRVGIAYQLMNLDKITHEELLKNLESYSEISSLFKIYEDYNQQVLQNQSQLGKLDLPLIDLNYSYVFDVMQQNENDSIQYLEIENLDLSNKFYNDIDLRVFSRYNYYNLVNTPTGNRSFVTFGVGLGVPISFQKKEKEQLYELQKLKIQEGDEDLKEQKSKANKDVLGFFYEFRYKLKQFNSFYYKQQYYKELLRQEQARYDIDPLSFNPLKALRWMDEAMSIEVEMIDLKQQLYLYALRILDVSPDLKAENLIQSLSLQELEMEQIVRSKKAIYVWSKTLLENDVDFLVNYLVLHKINKVIVSSSSEKTKLNSFLTKCKEAGINSEIMIGDNEMINSFDIELFKSKLIGIDLSLLSAVHLDVEPQTFEDWQTKKDQYALSYLKMYEGIHAWASSQNLRVNVSLPTYFPSDQVNELISKGAMIYFMCYENIKSDFLEGKIGAYSGENIVIALRVEDFSDMEALEQKIIELRKLMKPSGFIIHDLGRILEFDH